MLDHSSCDDMVLLLGLHLVVFFNTVRPRLGGSHVFAGLASCGWGKLVGHAGARLLDDDSCFDSNNMVGRGHSHFANE